MDIIDRYKAFPAYVAPEIATGVASNTQVIIIGAGPIGLAAAIDLAMRDIKVVVLEKETSVSTGSRAICWAKRTLEIFDRLGVADKMVAKGVTWQIGRTYWGDEEIYHFDLLPEQGHKNPAFINLQQYYVEHYLIERCRDFPDLIDMRFGTALTDVTQNDENILAHIRSDAGEYKMQADYMLACDGARSTCRQLLDLDFKGVHFTEKFLIADVKMDAPFPKERWFWFEPTFHSGQSALLHKQPDNIYRIDFQLPADADNAAETNPENVRARIEKLLKGRSFELDWVSIYQFHCRRLENFIHQRMIFVGDSAHIVSPFGARGGNGGIQDVDNLCWKLALVLKNPHNPAGKDLLASYGEERIHGADENIAHSSRTTKFMSPNSEIESLFRNNLLKLARQLPFARQLINAGRLSVPCKLTGLSLQTPQSAQHGALLAGMVCPDAPLYDENNNKLWLLNCLANQCGFTLLITAKCQTVPDCPPDIALLNLHDDQDNYIANRYGCGYYLIRPDQYIAAIWNELPSAAQIKQAFDTATCNLLSEER